MRTGTLRNSSRLAVFILLWSLLLSMPIVSATGQREASSSRVEQADREPQNWLTYYGNYSGWSYSPLDQINRSNVKRLGPVWTFCRWRNAADHKPWSRSRRQLRSS